MKKILLIGNSARAHVVAEAFKKNPQVELYAYMQANNPGIVELAKETKIGKYNDLENIKAFAETVKPNFAFVGPEAPLAAGVVDALQEIGIRSASPKQALAQIESSKSFARNLIRKYNIQGNPRFRVFKSTAGMDEFTKDLREFVVKADGLQGGKGVKVMGDHFTSREEGLHYAKECLEKDGRVVIEEKLVGQEFSLMSFVDGKTIKSMPASQDHKRAFDGDKGPNTGGMGTYSFPNHSLPFLKQEDIDQAGEITKQVMHALKEEIGDDYKGILYGGFIATKKGVRLIEYNARLGDPEAMNTIPILKTDFVEICEAIIDQTLQNVNVVFDNKATVCKYVVPEGYPDNPTKGAKIEVTEVPPGVNMYYASVDKKEDGLYLSGSRAIAMVGIADSILDAEQRAEKACSSVQGPVFHRKDIGTTELINKRIEHMKTLRV